MPPSRPLRSHPVPCSCARRHETQPEHHPRHYPQAGEHPCRPHRSFWPTSCPPLPLNAPPLMCRRRRLSTLGGAVGVVIGASDHLGLGPPPFVRLCPRSPTPQLHPPTPPRPAGRRSPPSNAGAAGGGGVGDEDASQPNAPCETLYLAGVPTDTTQVEASMHKCPVLCHLLHERVARPCTCRPTRGSS